MNKKTVIKIALALALPTALVAGYWAYTKINGKVIAKKKGVSASNEDWDKLVALAKENEIEPVSNLTPFEIKRIRNSFSKVATKYDVERLEKLFSKKYKTWKEKDNREFIEIWAILQVVTPTPNVSGFSNSEVKDYALNDFLVDGDKELGDYIVKTNTVKDIRGNDK